ncbi:hypothetical protein, partial [Streptomyces sp. T21Q-yed]|uniref:hypothetical protein n=1 Tax=Streptomyces sp. T21Q-yed TaxID=3018441 RepID=UPI0023E01D14
MAARAGIGVPSSPEAFMGRVTVTATAVPATAMAAPVRRWRAVGLGRFWCCFCFCFCMKVLPRVFGMGG